MDGHLIATVSPLLSMAAAIIAIAYNTRRLTRLADDRQDKRMRRIANEVHRPTTICEGRFFDKERGTKIEVQVERLQTTQDSGFHDMRTRLDDLRDMMNGKS